MVTEINFGIFFDAISERISYESVYGNFTPDWTIEINGQKIVAEVLRLNPSATDKKALDFDDDFINRIGEIKIGCFLSFKYNETAFDRASIDIQDCKSLIEGWLSRKPLENSVLILFDKIEVQLLAYKPSINQACLCGGGGSVKFDYRRLDSEKSPLVTKARKYATVIENYNLPYIICIYIDPHAWFRKNDMYHSLYGLSTEHLGPIKCYSHLLEDALYYSAEQIMKPVSGILLRQNDEYTYYHNFSGSNKLNNINKELFSKWQHPYE